MSGAEVAQVIEDFIGAAERAEKAGFDGVELHAAHGYLIGQFLSAEINRRDDGYGGSRVKRFRLLADIIDGVRQRCRPDFVLAVRLSPERFGMQLEETTEWAAQLMREGKIDLLDMSLWDAFKKPADISSASRICCRISPDWNGTVSGWPSPETFAHRNRHKP